MNERDIDLNKKADKCCGGPAIDDQQACCRQDEIAKTSGEQGCGCSDQTKSTDTSQSCCH